MTWFEELTGFREESPTRVRDTIAVDGETLTSRANGRTMVCGRLETPSLGELRKRVSLLDKAGGRLSAREAVADVRGLHADAANAGAFFQVASQFNLLEMTSPSIAPEQGVGIYEFDRTQGPACAIAAGAGTIYRNYFAPVNGQTGQSEDNQIDCLADLGAELGNAGERLWRMQNGYALATREGLLEIAERLRAAGGDERDRLRALLRIGVQWNTQATIGGCGHHVTQVYCSATPVAYSEHPPDLWEDFAKLVLEASYEAALCAAALNAAATGNDRVYLTLLGGGAFGNDPSWILHAMRRALDLHAGRDLNVYIVSYGRSNPDVRQLAEGFS